MGSFSIWHWLVVGIIILLLFDHRLPIERLTTAKAHRG